MEWKTITQRASIMGSSCRGMRTRLLAIVGVSSCLVGCGASIEQLKSRAAVDLSCPQEQLQVTEIDGRKRGVAGCGKKAVYIGKTVYIENCPAGTGSGNGDCTWVLKADTSPAK